MDLLFTSFSCPRCGDSHGTEFSSPASAKLKPVLTLAERNFISSKYNGPLCVACTRQLQTACRIQQGYYAGKIPAKDSSKDGRK